MRPAAALLRLAAVSAVLALEATPASAQYWRHYPWCAQYNLPGGPTSCRFSTFEQCLPEVRGVGGQCVVNPYYDGGGPPKGRSIPDGICKRWKPEASGRGPPTCSQRVKAPLP